ncbi:hypothetical protein Poli38472_000117 [Pythium oligandrum]|uniref:Leucine carboxyl methyltransferase 1 n=1 Tax=Pythium oligandrum TaxID=41045 RepID=A0A8K1FE28_PYTOL|nr:hypothetical protein Poli38472_000117 [Pythium oligandrum]|eukprot:TMW60075.1 hypothetical protein Poli38472_000117 [Pythium oligandrum]
MSAGRGADSRHDSAVMETASDASLCKLSASALGYFQDAYVQYFVKSPSRRMPIINRGYYARVAAMERVVTKFLDVHAAAPKVQVVILGAGLDTMYFRLKEKALLPSQCEYFELDFPDVTLQKVMTIRRRKPLMTALGLQSAAELQAAASSGGTALNVPGYHLIPGDLREIAATREKLEAAGIDKSAPTLFVSECVLIYMDAQYSRDWIAWSVDYFTEVSYVLYEQILPDDAFGRVMMENIKARGCDLISIRDYPTVDAQIERFRVHRFEMVQCWDMNDVYYKFLDASERTQREKLEIFDEVEEFHLLQAHYCLVVASKSAASTSARAMTLN